MLKSFYKSTSLRVAAAFALGGAVFAVGNLILARVLPPREYGIVSLIIGIISAATLIAPLGIDLLVTRRGLPLGRHLRRAALCASAGTAFVTALVTAVAYDLPVILVLCVFTATAAAGVSQAVAAHFQSRREFKFSVPILQASTWLLAPIAGITVWLSASTAILPTLLVTAAALLTGMLSWAFVVRRNDDNGADPHMGGHWREAFALVAVTAASALFMQLERLVLPATLGMEDVALFGVLASLVASPFRIIQGAIAYTVVPRLRDATSVTQRRQLLRHESGLVTVVLLAGSAVIWFAAAPVGHWLLAGRYDLSKPLITATLISGVLKVISAFGTSIVSALASEAGVRLLSIGSWVCVAVGTAASFPGAHWGLTGVIYAVSLGWLLRCALAAGIALPHLREAPVNV